MFHDRAALPSDRGGQRLRQEERAHQVRAHQVVPRGAIDAAERRGEEARCVVDQAVDAAEMPQRGCGHFLGDAGVAEVATDGEGRIDAERIERGRQ